MSDQQDLDDQHDALVCHFTGEYERFLENATGREQDIVRLKDAEKEQALTQLKQEHALEMQRKVADLQLQHRTTEAESVAKMERQKDKERVEVVKVLDQEHVEQAKQMAARFVQMRRESIAKCKEEMGKKMEETLAERNSKYADEIAQLQQQYITEKAEAVAQMEREKEQEKLDALAELGKRLNEEAHQARLRQRTQHYKDNNSLAQQKDKVKREALVELESKHAEDMKQVRIDLRKSMMKERAEEVASSTQRKDEEKERALAELHEEHVGRWKRIEQIIRDMRSRVAASKANVNAQQMQKHKEEQEEQEELGEDRGEDHTDVVARALADLEKSYVEREGEAVAQAMRKKDQEMEETIGQLRREHDQAIEALNRVAQAKEEELKAELTKVNQKHATDLKEYKSLKQDVERRRVLLQEKDACDADTLAKLARKKDEEREVALASLRRVTAWKVDALKADSTMYRELEAQTTKRLLDAVHPVLCWVRLHGDGQNDDADHVLEESTKDISKWDPDRFGDPGHVFYHSQHRTQICLPSEEKQWPFDRIFLESDPDEDLWNHVSPLIRSAMHEDRNAMIVTCGKSAMAKGTFHSLLRGTLDQILNDRSGPRFFVGTFDNVIHDTENKRKFDVSVEIFQEFDGNIDKIYVWAGEHCSARVKRINTNYYYPGSVAPKTEIVYQVDELGGGSHYRDAPKMEKYIHNILEARNRSANIFICLQIKDTQHCQRRGIVTLVELANKDDCSLHQPAQSVQLGVKDRPVPDPLSQLQGYLKCLAYTETRAAESHTAHTRVADEYDSPLTRLVRWATEIRRPQPLPSIVVIGHVSTVPEETATSKAMLEWLHGCRWHVDWLKRKAEEWPDAARTKLHDDLQRKALEWEDFARRNIEYETCQEFARKVQLPEKEQTTDEGDEVEEERASTSK